MGVGHVKTGHRGRRRWLFAGHGLHDIVVRCTNAQCPLQSLLGQGFDKFRAAVVLVHSSVGRKKFR